MIFLNAKSYRKIPIIFKFTVKITLCRKFLKDRRYLAPHQRIIFTFALHNPDIILTL